MPAWKMMDSHASVDGDLGPGFIHYRQKMMVAAVNEGLPRSIDPVPQNVSSWNEGDLAKSKLIGIDSGIPATFHCQSR